MSVLEKSFRQVKKKTLTVLDKQQLKSDWFVFCWNQQISQVEQELLTIPVHMSSLQVIRGFDL
jgi:hypothetical protein